MAKVRKFTTDVHKPEPEGQGELGAPKANSHAVRNAVPNLPKEIVETVTASAPVQIRSNPDTQDTGEKSKRGNPRKRRYKQKTYSLLQEDIDLIETLVADIRQGGLYERGRSDIVRAGVRLLKSLSLEERLNAVQAVENLRDR
jgi:Arc/MetJ-type ribon-helix-helix transcriptional regulator